jgi:hypothetical protein
MADTTVPITAGVGTGIAVEVQGGANYQVVVPGAHRASPYTPIAITLAGNGDNQVLAGVALQTIKVYGVLLYATAAAVNIKLTDGPGGTSFHGVAIPLLSQGASWFMPIHGNPYWTGTVANALTLNLSAAQNVSGCIWVIQS